MVSQTLALNTPFEQLTTDLDPSQDVGSTDVESRVKAPEHRRRPRGALHDLSPLARRRTGGHRHCVEPRPGPGQIRVRIHHRQRAPSRTRYVGGDQERKAFSAVEMSWISFACVDVHIHKCIHANVSASPGKQILLFHYFR